MARLISALVLLVLSATSIVAGSDLSHAQADASPSFTAGQSLSGKYLVASPELRDPNFAQTVIFMVQHDEDGAMGIVINRPIGTIPLAEVLRYLGIAGSSDLGSAQILYGGPVEPEAAFVLHSTDYLQERSVQVNEEIALTSNREIFDAIAKGAGPKRRLLVFGFAGWGPGQLEKELVRDSWFIIPGDVEFLFDRDLESKWNRARAEWVIDL